MGSKRIRFTALIASALIISSLAACSSGNANNGSAPETSGKAELTNGKIEPAVTITTVRAEDPTAIFKNGETYADNVHTRWARDTLGVNIETLWSSPIADTSFDTKLKLMLSSGDKLPDVFVSTSSATTNLFIDSGKVLEVGEVFDKYASPTLKAAMAESETAWHPFTRDGKKFAIPLINQTEGTQSPLWIRQDWLDKLKLKAPTTLEELEQVMDAFVNQDPDGNGKKDTYALDFGMKDTFMGYPIGDASWIFGLFGALPEFWYPNEDGKLQFGSIQPGIKDALAKLKEWKDKGYFASDIALHDFNKVAENVASGKVGILGGEYWLPSYPGSLLLHSNPKAMYTAYPLPAGKDGQNMRKVSNSYWGSILISKEISDESLQALFHYLNAMYEVYNQEDPFYFKGFQEGYDYVIKDGKVINNEAEIPGGKVISAKYTLAGNSFRYPSKMLETIIKRANGEPLTGKDLAAIASDAAVNDETNPIDKIQDQAIVVSISQKQFDVPNYFQGPTTKTMASRDELLKKMQMDTYTDIIYGKQPINAFDDFVTKWKSSGGDDITKEVNEWYDSVK